MLPYETIKLIPRSICDPGDIRREGRKSGIGNINKDGTPTKRMRAYQKAEAKKKIRRAIKRSDKARMDKLENSFNDQS